jgi:hypothetical protein
MSPETVKFKGDNARECKAFRLWINRNSPCRLAFSDPMQDAKTYRLYAEECRKLAESLPKHRKPLLDMAAVWAELAEKADRISKEKDGTGS